MKNKFSLGADPELFLCDAAGALVSAIGRIGGSKENPRPLPIGEGFAVQEDNVALEYNIPASHSKDAFINNINRAMSYLSDEVSTMGLKFSALSATAFPKEQLTAPEALVFGCDPDFNAWDKGMVNPRPQAKNKRLRSCGGHVHVGMEFESEEQVWDFIKHCDLFLSVPAALMDNGELRKQLYGKRGAFRYKPYGCEYRSLSNFWTLDTKYTEWVWDSVAMAMDAWQNKTINVDDEDVAILDAVNNNNKQAAQFLVDKYSLMVV